MYRVLKKDSLMVSFYGWNRIDRFMAAWKKRDSVLLATWFLLKPIHQSLPGLATAMSVLICWLKAVRPCRKTRCRTFWAGNTAVTGITQLKNP
ncbi:MAG: hypothetical protein XXXJIFNMEKO3_LKCDNKCA_00102 (plasmid) [Candidatus Erwinia impunctatus]